MALRALQQTGQHVHEVSIVGPGPWVIFQPVHSSLEQLRVDYAVVFTLGDDDILVGAFLHPLHPRAVLHNDHPMPIIETDFPYIVDVLQHLPDGLTRPLFPGWRPEAILVQPAGQSAERQVLLHIPLEHQPDGICVLVCFQHPVPADLFPIEAVRGDGRGVAASLRRSHSAPEQDLLHILQIVIAA